MKHKRLVQIINFTVFIIVNFLIYAYSYHNNLHIPFVLQHILHIRTTLLNNLKHKSNGPSTETSKWRSVNSFKRTIVWEITRFNPSIILNSIITTCIQSMSSWKKKSIYVRCLIACSAQYEKHAANSSYMYTCFPLPHSRTAWWKCGDVIRRAVC